VLKTPNTLSVGGKLDLTDNKMIVTTGTLGTYSGSYNGITGLVANARNGGDWLGSSGITTSMTAASTGAVRTTLGVAKASDISKTSLGGVPVLGTDILVMYTYNGDANLNGRIDGDDYFYIDSNYHNSGNQSLQQWSKGDFNYNGVTDGDDY